MLEIARTCLALLLSCSLVYGGWSAVEPHADPYDTLILVNRNHKAPTATPETVLPDIPPSKAANAKNLYLQPVAAEAMEQMFAAALVEGHALYGVSGYRSAGSQGVIYERRVGESGDAAKKWVAPPGYSEHQTGLVMDITGESTLDKGLAQTFADSDEGKWVADNAHRFGFVVRYQPGWESVTGYGYEPWHLRYVGLEHAARLYELKIPLEEYLPLLQRERWNEMISALELASETAAPSEAPDQAAEPTIETTIVPTVEPTTEPTIAPTIAPTTKPVMEPGKDPTAEPTAAPNAISPPPPTQAPGPNPFGTPKPAN